MTDYHRFVTPNEFRDLGNNHNGIYTEFPEKATL